MKLSTVHLVPSVGCSSSTAPYLLLYHTRLTTLATLLVLLRHCTLILDTNPPWPSYTCTCGENIKCSEKYLRSLKIFNVSGLTSPDEREKSSSLESGDQHTPVRVTFLISLPQILLPSTLPTMTAPSSYTMQILWPSVFHAMPRTTDLLRLLIISSYLETRN